MELTTPSMILRPPVESDAESIARYANNRNVWLGVRDRMPYPYAVDDAKEFIELASRLDRPTVFVMVFEGESIGMIGLELQRDVYRHSGEIGYWLGEPFWGRGLATEALERMTRYGFESLDLRRISSQVFGSNPASRRVLEKAGYSLEGTLRNGALKDGKLLDVFVYGRLRDDRWEGSER